MKVIEYTLAAGSGYGQVIYDVERLINEGWQPLGGIATQVSINGSWSFHQAMAKYEEEPIKTLPLQAIKHPYHKPKHTSYGAGI